MFSGQEMKMDPHCRKCGEPRLFLFDSGNVFLCSTCAPPNAPENLSSFRTGYRPPVAIPAPTSIRDLERRPLTRKGHRDRERAERLAGRAVVMLSPRIQ